MPHSKIYRHSNEVHPFLVELSFLLSRRPIMWTRRHEYQQIKDIFASIKPLRVKRKKGSRSQAPRNVFETTPSRKLGSSWQLSTRDSTRKKVLLSDILAFGQLQIDFLSFSFFIHEQVCHQLFEVISHQMQDDNHDYS